MAINKNYYRKYDQYDVVIFILFLILGEVIKSLSICNDLVFLFCCELLYLRILGFDLGLMGFLFEKNQLFGVGLC